MNLGSGTGSLDAFAQPAEHFPAALPLAGIQRFDGLEQLIFQFVQRGGNPQEPRFAFFLETAQTGADHFARSLVKAAADFFLHKFFQLWRQRHIHNQKIFPTGGCHR
jgi:hypothetical protein